MSESENVEETELEHLARQFHEWYEANAREMGWETQAASRTTWEDMPAANRTLTRATVGHVIGPLLADRDRLRARVAELEGLLHIALDIRGGPDVFYKGDGWVEHTVKGAHGAVYHDRDQECRLCELLACAVRIEDGEQQR